MSLSQDEIARYSAQIKLDNIGEEGQLKLKNAKVLCVGAGGLGCSLLWYLTAAGIGTIGIIDNDVIELRNLQRQILYQKNQINCKKAFIAKQQLALLNSEIEITTYPESLDICNAKSLISQYDIITDCSDNFFTRYLLNDMCFHLEKPLVYACASHFEGQCSVFLGRRSACLRCLFPAVKTEDNIFTCKETGVLGVVPGLLGIIQATEVIKLILGLGDIMVGNVLIINVLKMQFQKFILNKNPNCHLCCGS